MAWRCSGRNNAELIANLFQNQVARNERVKQAMFAVDRKNYSLDVYQAYVDAPHPIGYGATISAPHIHAMCLDLLEPNLKEGAKALDVGCGSGYLTACMAKLVGSTGKVIGVEHIDELTEFSKQNTKKGNPELFDSNTVAYFVGDGHLGFPEEAPYDCIHVGAAAAKVPFALIDQLKVGGRLVIPVGTDNQELLLIKKGKDNNDLSQQNITGVRYVPLTNKSAQLKESIF